MQNENSPKSDTSSDVSLRGFRDRSDFDIIADIRNRLALKHQGAKITALDAKTIENIVSANERLQIAQINGVPVSFIFVTKEGSVQLDEYGTSEGRTWLFVGPTSLPEYEKKGTEEKLLQWLITYAEKMGISTLIRFMRATTQEYIKDLLKSQGFCEVQQYYHMQLELAEPPSPRPLPEGFELIDFHSVKDFDMLWRVLDAAFDYKEKDETYKKVKHIFGSLESAYMPICVELDSQQPVGTIAAVEMKAAQTGAIATFGVIPSHQGKGIGSLLMERALDYFWQSNVRTVELSVRVKNRQALGIYEHFGFRVVPDRTTVVIEKNL